MPQLTMTAAQIEAKCRFVFNHRGGRIGLTTDGMLADAARAALLPVQAYWRAPEVPEWEIHFEPELGPKELGFISVPQREE